MMLEDCLVVLRKELRRTFTDRRTLFFLVVLPLVMLPVIYSVMHGMGKAKMDKLASTTFTVYVCVEKEDLDGADPFIEAISSLNADLVIIDPVGLDEAVRRVEDGKVDLLVVLPGGLDRMLETFEPFDVAVYYNSTSDLSMYAFGQVTGVLDDLSGGMATDRLIDMGIPAEVMTVFTVNGTERDYDLSPAGGTAVKVMAMLLPFFVLIYLFANSMKVGLDIVAGEKERGTLAIQLVNQVDRIAIVLGKMGAVMAAAVAGAVSSVTGLLIATRYFGDVFGGSGTDVSKVSIGTVGILQFAVVVVPLAVMIAGVILVISTYARNEKEGQGMVMPVYIVVMIMGIASMEVGDSAPPWMILVPVFNSLVVMGNILTGDARWSDVLVVSFTSILFSALSVYLALRMFRSEKVLFRI